MSIILFPVHRARSAASPDAAPADAVPPARPAGAPHRPGDVRWGRALRRLRSDRGAATAEYAIVIMAAVALASVLVMVVQSDAVRQIIENLVLNAFQGG